MPQSQLYSGTAITVNFQPLAGRVPLPVPAGYLPDNGGVFADQGNGYSDGWNRRNAKGGKHRNSLRSPDQRYDTFLMLRKPTARQGVWEMAVTNGAYRVHVVSGDANGVRGVFRTNVEGTAVVSGNASAAGRWVEGWADVAVADGRLSVSGALEAKGNKINFIDVLPLDAGSAGSTASVSEAAPAPPSALNPLVPAEPATPLETARGTRDLLGSGTLLE